MQNFIRSYNFNDEAILDEIEQKIIVDWTINNYHYFDQNGFARCKQTLDYFDELPDVFNNIKQRIVEKENLHEYKTEPLFKDSIAYHTNGGKLHLHSDPKTDGLEHIRFNVYVQLPYIGGRPVYDGKERKLQERRYICCWANRGSHEATMVEGDRARIIISYGFLIPKIEVGSIIYNY